MDNEYKGRWWELYAGPTDIDTDELSEYQQKLLDSIDFSVLNWRQKQVIRYIYFDGLTEREAAKEMKVSHQAVHKMKRNALKRLRKQQKGCQKTLI